MAIKVRIPSPLRKLTQEKSEVEASGQNIGDLINHLDGAYPGLKERICEEDGSIRRFVNIYLNEEDIRFLKGMDSAVKDGDEVSIVPAMAGGQSSEKRVTSIKVRITFPEEKIKEPIIYNIGKEFDVTTNIRKADVTEKTGWVDLELTGEPNEVEKAVSSLQKKGVQVDPIERNIIE